MAVKKANDKLIDANYDVSRDDDLILNYSNNSKYNPIGKPKVLLHSCCGPCSTAVIERLVEDYDITVFYYNPCITDWEEYEKRKKNQIKFINKYNEDLIGDKGKSIDNLATLYNKSNQAKVSKSTIKFKEGNYDPENFLELVKGHESDPEGGERCAICFKQRLEETAKMAKELGMDCFTTTLTVSPHKNYEVITKIGTECSQEYDIEYLDRDFKKKAGFQRSIELSKEYELYRQNYCGCKYSKDK